MSSKGHVPALDQDVSRRACAGATTCAQAGQTVGLDNAPVTCTGPDVEFVTNLPALRQYEPAWQRLADHAIEPNVFHEPWQMLPAVEAFGAGKSSVFIFVYGSIPGPQPARELIGFFPFERVRGLRGVPAVVLRAWQHPHLVLSTPLIHADFGVEAWSKLFAWIATGSMRISLLEFQQMLCEGAGYCALVDAMNAAGLISCTLEQYTRAQISRAATATTGPLDALSSGARKELRRQRRRLSELGRLEFRQLERGAEPGQWIEQFEALEASGWKGGEGTALRCQRNESQYFREICKRGHARGQLQLLGLFLDDVPIAMKCNFLSGPVGFTLKIAYDEAYGAYSPGILLELYNLEAFLQAERIERMDSCAVANHVMINRLWRGRRAIADLLVSAGSVKGNLQIGGYCLLRSLKRSFGRARRKEA